MENIQITNECLKTISNFGYMTYQNVCNGTVSTVAWGSLDYMLFWAFTFIALFFIGMFTIMFIKLITL